MWVDNALLDSLGLAVGDALLLGDASLKIARIIVIEPDRGAGFASLAPRVMLNAADVPATGLVQPASRITYRFAVAGQPAAVKAFAEWAAEEVKKPDVRAVRVESLESGRPEMRQTLGTAVFSGMLGVTLFGIFLTPVFFFAIDWLGGTRLFASQAMTMASNGLLAIVTLRPARNLVGYLRRQAGEGSENAGRPSKPVEIKTPSGTKHPVAVPDTVAIHTVNKETIAEKAPSKAGTGGAAAGTARTRRSRARPGPGSAHCAG